MTKPAHEQPAAAPAVGTIRLAGVAAQSIVDGPGLRMAIFTQGCPHRCPGCHNPHSHDPDAGYEASLGDLLEQFDRNPLLAGVTLSGGEPFAQAAALGVLAEAVRRRGKSVWCYTGYAFEDIAQACAADPAVRILAAAIDVLVDGPFIQARRSLALRYRGSDNQRLIDMPGSLAAGRAKEWVEPEEPLFSRFEDGR